MDEIFALAAARAGSIDNLLDAFFSFLDRRSDFYDAPSQPTASQPAIGFAPGVARQLVQDAFMKHERLHEQRKKQPAKPPAGKRPAGKTPALESPATLEKKEENPTAIEAKWGQTIDEVQLELNLGRQLTKNDIEISIFPHSVRVQLSDAPQTKASLWTADLNGEIEPAQSQWWLCGNCLTFELSKSASGWWKKYTDADKTEIDVSTLKSEVLYGDLDASLRLGIQRTIAEKKY